MNLDLGDEKDLAPSIWESMANRLLITLSIWLIAVLITVVIGVPLSLMIVKAVSCLTWWQAC